MVQALGGSGGVVKTAGSAFYCVAGPAPLRLGVDGNTAGGDAKSSRALFGHLCSGDDRHVLLSLCFINALMSSTAVNKSIIRRARFVSRSKATEHSLLDELVGNNSQSVSTNSEERLVSKEKEGGIFDDKKNTVVHNSTSLKQIFGTSSIGSADGFEEEHQVNDSMVAVTDIVVGEVIGEDILLRSTPLILDELIIDL